MLSDNFECALPCNCFSWYGVFVSTPSSRYLSALYTVFPKVSARCCGVAGGREWCLFRMPSKGGELMFVLNKRLIFKCCSRAISGECRCWRVCNFCGWTILDAFAKLRKAIISFDMSVRPPARKEHLCSHWTDFDEVWYLRFFPPKICREDSSLIKIRQK